MSEQPELFNGLSKPPTKLTEREAHMAVMVFNHIATLAHNNAVEKGHWQQPRNFPESIAYAHCELSEAITGYIKDLDDKHLPQHKNAAVEAADAIISILDTCKGFELAVGQALVDKLNFNADRPMHHGSKVQKKGYVNAG